MEPIIKVSPQVSPPTLGGIKQLQRLIFTQKREKVSPLTGGSEVFFVLYYPSIHRKMQKTGVFLNIFNVFERLKLVVTNLVTVSFPWKEAVKRGL